MRARCAATLPARCSHGCAHWTRTGPTRCWPRRFLVEGLLEVLFLLPDESPRNGLIAALVAGLAACVALRRRAPGRGALVGMALFCALARSPARCTPSTSSARSSSRSSLSTASAAHLEGRVVWVAHRCAAVLMTVFTAVEQTDDAVGIYVHRRRGRRAGRSSAA